MSKFIICDELIIPINHMSVIIKSASGKGYSVGRCNPDGKFVTWDNITVESFNQIKENILQTEKTERKIKKLEQKIKDLELHINLSPGGIEYLNLQKDFKGKQKVDN